MFLGMFKEILQVFIVSYIQKQKSQTFDVQNFIFTPFKF